MSLPNDNLHVDLKAIDNVCTIVGGEVIPPIADYLGADGAWLDAKTDELSTYEASPTYPGAGWSGSGWSGSGLGPYTHTPPDITRLTNVGILTDLTRIQTTFTVSDRTVGTVRFVAGGTLGSLRSTNETFTEDLTCSGTDHSFEPSIDFDGKVTIVNITCLSVNTQAFRSATGAFLGKVFVQATNQYKGWYLNGLNFDGGGDFMSESTIPMPQPIHMFFVAQWKASGIGSTMVDDTTGNKMRILEASFSPSVALYAGATACDTVYVDNVLTIFEAVFNGASSKMALNGGAPVVGDPGSGAGATGISLASYGGAPIQTGEFLLKGAVFRYGELSAGDRTALVALLTSYYGVV